MDFFYLEGGVTAKGEQTKGREDSYQLRTKDRLRSRVLGNNSTRKEVGIISIPIPGGSEQRRLEMEAAAQMDWVFPSLHGSPAIRRTWPHVNIKRAAMSCRGTILRVLRGTSGASGRRHARLARTIISRQQAVSLHRDHRLESPDARPASSEMMNPALAEAGSVQTTLPAGVLFPHCFLSAANSAITAWAV